MVMSHNDIPHQQEQNDPLIEDSESQHIPLSQKHPSSYGMAHTQYQLDYNHDHRPISVWDGTTHTDITYDDNDEYRTHFDYAYGDSFNMNDPSV